MSDTLSLDSASDRVFRGYELLRSTCGRIELEWLQVIQLEGEDRKGWLQGQATQDLRNLRPGGFLNFCLCSPTGQIEAVCQLWSVGDRFIITTDRRCADVVLQRVEKYVLMEDVRANVPDVVLVSLQGPDASRILGELIELPSLDSAEIKLAKADVLLLRSNRTGLGGWDLVIPRTAKAALQAIREKFEEVDAESYRIASLEAGVPHYGVDIDSKTLPPELGEAFESSHVSYKKGCYQGQEVLMRIYSRGHTNRTWVALLSELPLAEGNPIVVPGRGQIGVVTSAFDSPEFGFIAAGYVRNDYASNRDYVSVRTEVGDIPAEVQEMPLLRFN